MNRSLIVFLIGCLVVSVAVIGTASAAPGCFPTDALDRVLNKEFGEYPAAVMLRHDGVPIGIYANSRTGTWTMIQIGPEQSCVVATGTEYRTIGKDA